MSAYSALNRLCWRWPVELWLLGSSIPTSRGWFIHLLSWGSQGDKPSKVAWDWGISWDPGLFNTNTRIILGKLDGWSSEEMSLFWKHMQGGKRSLGARCWHCFTARMLALVFKLPLTGIWGRGELLGQLSYVIWPSLERPTWVSLRATQSHYPGLVCLWRGLKVCKLIAQSLAACMLLAISWLYLAFSSVFGFPDETHFCGRHWACSCLGDQRPRGLPGWAVVEAETQGWGQQGYDGRWGSVPVILGTSNSGEVTWEMLASLSIKAKILACPVKLLKNFST